MSKFNCFYLVFAVVALASILFVYIGESLGVGNPYRPDEGNYQVERVLDAEPNFLVQGEMELFLRPFDDSSSYYSIVSADCFKGYKTGAEILIINDDDTCLWLASPPD